MASILSERPDGVGFHYGFCDGDSRRIDVRQENKLWTAYVEGTSVGSYLTKDDAEASAIRFIKGNPVEQR